MYGVHIESGYLLDELMNTADGNDDGLRWAKAAKIVAFLNMLLNCYLLYRHPELLSFPFLQQPQSSSGILP